MATRLDNIVAQTRKAVETQLSTTTSAQMAALEGQAAGYPPRGFAAALHRAARHAPAIIAELKKASPSKGLIRADFVPQELALNLAACGAAALSVLTDEPFFQGSLRNLQLASAAVTIPCLRKDFIVDPFQILEARAAGADAILLIVAAHPDAVLRTLRQSARDYSLGVLCEVHSADELARAEQLGCECIGVNSRDLRDFSVHPELLTELVPKIPPTVVRVAESGITSGAEVAALRAAGYHAFLMGEALMRQPNPGLALAALLQQAADLAPMVA